jgi:hypothetical protein
MNYEEFLQKLRETPRDWALTANGEIRRKDKHGMYNRCPGLECGLFDSRYTWVKRWDIAKAADNDKKHDPQIRADLLAACGLTEVK